MKHHQEYEFLEAEPAKAIEPITNYSWEDLNAYHFSLHPHFLTVIAPIDKDQWLQAVHVFNNHHSEGNLRNIEDIIEHLFKVPAVTANNSNFLTPL